MVMVGGPLTVILKFWVAFGTTPFVAVTVPVKVPDAVGVPEITPAELIVKPVGKLPAVTLSVGVGKPVNVYVKL